MRRNREHPLSVYYTRSSKENKMGHEQENTGKILIYQTEKGDTKIDVYFEEDTIWMTQRSMCELYQVAKSSISEHISHIYEDGELDEEAQKVQDEMTERAVSILSSLTDREISLHAGSTDCNIPLSMNIPSLCYGFYLGEGAHTREEYVEISSLKTGYIAAFESILDYFAIQ